MTNNGNDALVRRTSSALAKRYELVERIITPVADVFETPDAFVVKLDMPGVTKEAVTVSVRPGRLSASGAIGPLHQQDAHLLCGEIGRKSYSREFNLGEGVDQEDVEAQFEDGVLTIRLPKTEDMKAKQIPIK
jgi:HSP20 family protein